jgi:tetratricopeptide (TPR) repeat protein
MIENDRLSPAALEGLLRAEPYSVPLCSQLAEAYFRAGRFEDCRRCITGLQAQGVDTALGRVALAILDFMAGQAGGALIHIRRAEAMPGVSARLLELIGRLYLRLRRPEEANRVLQRAIAAAPEAATAHDACALACLLQKDFVKAEQSARQAIALDRTSFESHYHLGLILERDRRIDEAIEVYKQALTTRKPNEAAVHRRLAELYKHQGNHSLAFHHRAIASRSKQPRRLPGFDLEWSAQGLLS